jgi:predicted ATP-dependent serine protease
MSNNNFEKNYPGINTINVPVPRRILFPAPMEHLNTFFGTEHKPGMLECGSYFITGEQNSGKTTLVLQMADALASAGHDVLVDSTEMILSEINDRRKEIGLTQNISIRGADSDGADDDPTKLFTSYVDNTIGRDTEMLVEFHRRAQILMERGEMGSGRSVILFIDSLQSLVGGRGEGLDLVKRTIKLVQRCHGIVFFIGQVTKAGTAAGFNTVPHLVTAHVHLSVLSNEKEDQKRLIHLEKNRAGPANSFITNLGETGHKYMAEGPAALAHDNAGSEEQGDE